MPLCMQDIDTDIGQISCYSFALIVKILQASLKKIYINKRNETLHCGATLKCPYLAKTKFVIEYRSKYIY